ncbi:MAG: hypothetical protein Q7U60_06780, partial [Candidatus Methanoperedens sp.]|nr:hypothetical protein [Candidatus Methanoperedens sp.]
MIVLQDNKKISKRIYPRLIVPVFFVLSLSLAALYYVSTAEEKTSGDITFTDSAGNPLMGAVELSGAGISSGLKTDVSYISWTNIPNAAIYFNVLYTRNVSVNLRITGNSPKSKIILDNFGIDVPKSVSLQAPGIPVKYVEISAFGVSFAEAEISIQYSDAEVKGLDEKTLAIYRYDGASQVWSELPTEIDAKNNILSATVNYLSVFAVSAGGQKIVVLDTKKTSVVSDIKTYDEAKNLRKKTEKTDTLPASDISDKSELEIDALSNKNVAVKLKIDRASGGEVILDDYGKNNPVSVPLPGKAIKFVEISASNISYSSAEVTIHYSEAELEGADESRLTVYHWNGAAWEALATHIDAVNNLLSANTTSLSAFGAAAPGAPSKLIMWTDRKVYTDWMFSQNKAAAAPNVIETGATQYDLVFYVYAVVLDDDGNIMKGRTSYLSGTINDIAQLDHYNKGSSTTHHQNVTDPNLISGTLTFKDDGSVTGDVSGDGIYTAVYNPTDFADSWGTSNVAGDDHYLINVTVADSNMGRTVYTYVLLTGIRCHQSFAHGTHNDEVMPAGVDNCAVCHPGYEHFFENKSGTIPESMQDVHFKKVPEPSVIADDQGFGDFVWNLSYTATGKVTGVDWKTYWPGSGYCPFCHTDTAGNVLDYSGGDRTPAPLTKPSCSVASTYYGTCHQNTEIEGVPAINWSQSAGTTVKRQNYNISLEKSHNHTGNKANVSCAICHGGSHSLNLPNVSYVSYTINEQCWFCHNITGGYLNITSNGGTRISHNSPDCKICHKNTTTSRLDVHNVSTAIMGNCSACHNVGGSAGAGKLVNFTAMNSSNAIHSRLNINASTPSGFNASNFKCWACHGNGSEPSVHPDNYQSPSKCVDCHVNRTNLNYTPNSTLLNVTQHYWNGSNITTANATSCYACHNRSEMMLGSFDPDGAA